VSNFVPGKNLLRILPQIYLIFATSTNRGLRKLNRRQRLNTTTREEKNDFICQSKSHPKEKGMNIIVERLRA